MSKKVLVTGGAGFIGTNLCGRLLSQGHRVICIDNLYTSKLQNIKHLLSNAYFTFFKEDITTFEKDIVIDQIYNLACPASPKQYQKDPIFTMKTNIYGIQNMLALARKTNARILQASTSEIYGNPLVHPQIEEYWGNVNCIGIRSCYDEGKRAAETLCMDYHRRYHTDIRIVRIFNTYGPHMGLDDGRVVSNFIVKALNNEPLEVYGDGTQTRSFCYVDDLLDSLIKMMAQGASVGPLNLGNDDEYTILEIAQKIISLTKSKSKIIYKPLPENDPARRKPNLNRTKEILAWNPQIQLEDGLIKTIDYFKKQLLLLNNVVMEERL